jgi:transcriptional regulator GlxA family with amidase domain
MTLLSHDKKPVQSVTVEAFEKHYSILEIAKMWSLSERTIRRMFDGEEGVVNWEHAESKRKRHYQTLRIPESVMMRVYQRVRKTG